jgi:hypothetical protein
MGINLRQEFSDLFEGTTEENSIAQTILIRRLRRDPITLARQKCNCISVLTGEPDLDHMCPFCLGVGYYFDESWGRAFGRDVSPVDAITHQRAGKLDDNLKIWYLEYDANLYPGDSIIEVVLDEEGNVAQPPRRWHIWTPTITEEKRLESGRIEYYKLLCQRTNAVYIHTTSFINNP